MSEARDCRACKQPLVRRPQERPHMFSRRYYCNRTCFLGRYGVKQLSWGCKTCGETISINPAKRYREHGDRRQYCSRKCWPPRKQAPVPFREDKKAVCVRCTQPLVRRTGESRPNFAVRQHCGRTCWNGRGYDVPEDRWCEWCGEGLRRRVGEDAHNWKVRRFCTLDCYRDMAFSEVHAPVPGSPTTSREANEVLAALASQGKTAAEMKAVTGVPKRDIWNRLRRMGLAPKRVREARP